MPHPVLTMHSFQGPALRAPADELRVAAARGHRAEPVHRRLQPPRRQVQSVTPARSLLPRIPRQVQNMLPRRSCLKPAFVKGIHATLACDQNYSLDTVETFLSFLTLFSYHLIIFQDRSELFRAAGAAEAAAGRHVFGLVRLLLQVCTIKM